MIRAHRKSFDANKQYGGQNYTDSRCFEPGNGLYQISTEMFDTLLFKKDKNLQLADQFCNSIGILQQSAKPGQFGGFERCKLGTF